jgi:hypothetical protein
MYVCMYVCMYGDRKKTSSRSTRKGQFGADLAEDEDWVERLKQVGFVQKQCMYGTLHRSTCMCIQEKASKLTQSAAGSAEDEIRSSIYTRQADVKQLLDKVLFSLELFGIFLFSDRKILSQVIITTITLLLLP